MKRNVMALVFFLLTRAAQKLTINQEAFKDMTQLKLQLLYLRMVKTTRVLFMTTFGMGICLVFIFASLVLFHATFFLYAPLTVNAKMWIGFACAAIYLFIAVKVFTSIFAEEKWIKIFIEQEIQPQ